MNANDDEKKQQPEAADGKSVVAAAMPPPTIAGEAAEEAPIAPTPEPEAPVADPATAALTAGSELGPQADDATPENEQEDPSAGRDLPGNLPEEEQGNEAPEDESATTPRSPAADAEDDAPEWLWEDDEEEADDDAPLTLPAARSVPLLPAPAAAPTAEQQQYWRGVLTGSADTVPDAVRQRAGADDPGLSDEQREYRLLSTINRSWAADNLGVSREHIRSGWAGLRARLAERFHVADDEHEVFTALSVESQNAPRREAAAALYEKHYRAALLGQPPPAIAAREEQGELAAAPELAETARRLGEAKRLRHLPLAQELAEGLNVFAGLEEDAVAAPRVLSSAPELARAIEQLAGLDDSSRQRVYAIAQGLLRQQKPANEGGGLYNTMLRASRRGATGIGLGAGQAVANASVATLHSLGSMLGDDYGRPLREASKGLDLRARIFEETRRLLQEEVNPLTLKDESGFAGRLMVDAAGATPAAIAACCGGAGFATLGLSGMGDAVAAARQRAPEGRQWLQYLAGVIGGGIQASIYSGMSRVGGQLLSNAIGRFARSTGKGASGYALSSLGVLGAVGFEEAKLLFASKSAEAAGLGTQELAARLERTASNIDWSEYGDNAQDIELNLREAAMNLPFILIASGRVALRHFRSREAVLGEGNALLDWGIDKATRDAIMKERNIDRQGDMLREALRSSKRWSAPGFLMEAARALRLLNTDYYQGFKDTQAVVDFMRLPSQNSQVPRPPFIEYSAENPAHTQSLLERHGPGRKSNSSRLALALQLWDEWWQKAHIIPTPDSTKGKADEQLPLPTAQRRRHFGLELLRLDNIVPPRMRPGGFYAPHAEAERMAMLRDRVAELHDLSYQMLMTSFPLDALSHSTRGIDHLRKSCEESRRSLLEAVGRAVLRRATGVPEHKALDELSKTFSGYMARRRYSSFPPEWMSRVRRTFTQNLDDYAMATALQDLPEAPPELLDSFRVALGLRACTNALFELLPTTPDFQTGLSRGKSPAEMYLHLVSRELGIDLSQAKGVQEMLAPLGKNVTDMREYRHRNAAAYEPYRLITGHEIELGKGDENGRNHWRLKRPNGTYTNWHLRKISAINDLMANAAFTFMPINYNRMKPFRSLRRRGDFDLADYGRAKGWEFTGFEHLCRVALRDSARAWLEVAPYAQPGFALEKLRQYVYLGGQKASPGVYMREGGLAEDDSVQVDAYTLSSPMRLAQARFQTYWWRQLRSGALPVEAAGAELVRLGLITPAEVQRIKDISIPLLMPRRKDVPLRLTPPPDIRGMYRAMAYHLTDFSMRYFLGHLDEMPMPASAREWFKLAAICPLRPGRLPSPARRLSLKRHNGAFTCWVNRMAAKELQSLAPAVVDIRRAEREGLLNGSPLLSGTLSAAGLNPQRNQEQAWCMRYSGPEAFMSATQAYWQLLERPLKGWSIMPPAEQQAIRAHVESVCRTELTPDALEAEARGEHPDYVMSGLQNLQDVLQEYPSLHQYDIMIENGQPRMRVITLDDPAPGGDPFAEPEYTRPPLYTGGGSMKKGYTLSLPCELPESLQGDTRILPAMHLLSALRSYPSSRPCARREGIQWKGELYGGPEGLRPVGLGEGWAVEAPLEGLISMLRRVDALTSTLPEGRKLELFEQPLEGLGEELDLSSLTNVTVYRSLENASHICRLMPGELESLNPAAHAPYVTHSLSGIYHRRFISLREPEEMYLSYMPLDKFRSMRTRMRSEVAREKVSRQTFDYTLRGVLSSTMRMMSQDNPQGGIAGMRELLMRFAEDSGFSEAMRSLDPRELTYGQVLALKLAREMLLCVCGDDPGAAYRRLIRLSHRIRRSESIRGAVLRALSSASDDLYNKGTRQFIPRETDSAPQKRRRRTANHFIRQEEHDQLDAWIERQDRLELENTERYFGGFEDELTPSGFSKGFFDIY